MDDLVAIRIKVLGGKQAALEAEAPAKGFEKTAAAAETAGARTATAGNNISRSLKRSAAGLATVGRGLTKYVTAPILGVGIAAGVMAANFDRQMTLISTQAGGSATEVAKLKGQVLDLAGASEFGPTKLAEALFHIESVGYRGAKAMAALHSAVDLATVGNADLESTTNALVGAMRTGIKGAQDMEQTIGTLNAGIGAGNLRMEDLNAAIGTGFLTSAKQVGLTLRDSVAALGELTSQGIPASAAATRLRMTFTLMAAPTAKAKDALHGIGIGSEDLAKRMRQPNGLVSALALLQEHMKGLSKVQQTQLLSEAFGGARSGTTIMALLGQLGDLSKKYREVGENADNFGKKLRETQEQPMVKAQEAWSKVQAGLIKIGQALLPAAIPAMEAFANAAAGIAASFSALPGSTQHTLVTLGLIAAALGPILVLSSKILKAWVFISESSAMGGIAGRLTKGRVLGGAAGLLAAQTAGGLIGGKTGSAISNIGTGAALGTMVAPGLGTAVGATAGAVVTALPEWKALLSTQRQITLTQFRLARDSRMLTSGMKAQRGAAQGLTAITDRLHGAQSRQRKTAQAVERAERQLREDRRTGAGNQQVIRDEMRVTRAINGHRRALHSLKEAQREHGIALEQFKQIARTNVLNERNEVNVLQRKKSALDREWQAAVRSHAGQEKLNEIATRGQSVTSALARAHKRMAETLQEAATKGGPKFATFLRDANREALIAGGRFQLLNQQFANIETHLRNISQMPRPQFNLGGPALPNAGAPSRALGRHRSGRTPNPQPSQRAALLGRSGGRRARLEVLDFKMNARNVAKATVEVQEDEEARL